MRWRSPASRLLGAVLAGMFVAASCSSGDSTTTATSIAPITSTSATASAPPTASTAATAATTTVVSDLVPSTLAAGLATSVVEALVPPTLPDPTLYPPLPPQPADVPFPTVDWPVGPLPPGVPVEALDSAVDEAFGTPDASARVRSLLVVLGGRLVYERYHPLDSAQVVTPSFSVAKSFTSAAIGLLAGDGLLDVTEPAPIEAWSQPSDPRGAITPEDLLHMSSGLEWTEVYEPGSDPMAMLGAPDSVAYTIDKPLVAEPGTVFNYSTGTSGILSHLISLELGSNDAAIDYITTRLLEPIGITSLQFMRDSTGLWYGGIGADATPRDYARFGLLYLRDGVWDGEQILPAGWVDYTRTPAPANAAYGAHWWLDAAKGTFSALGLFGQRIIVSPRLDMVIVTTSTQGGDSETLSNVVHDLFDDSIG